MKVKKITERNHGNVHRARVEASIATLEKSNNISRGQSLRLQYIRLQSVMSDFCIAWPRLHLLCRVNVRFIFLLDAIFRSHSNSQDLHNK